MPSQCPNQPILDRVPDLQLSLMRTDGEEMAISAPLDAGYAVLRAEITQLVHLAVRSRPQVDA